MPESELDQTLAAVARRISPHGTLLRTWPLKGGISAQMTVLEILQPDGHTAKLVLRRPADWALQQNPHAAADEYRLLQTLQSIGVAVPRPIHLDESGDILPAPYLVLEYVDGQPEVAPANITDCVCLMALQLAHIHSIDGSHPGLSILAAQTPAFDEPPARLDTSIDEGGIRDAIASALPLPPGNPPALLHGDFWPGNLLWKDGRLIAVIDWEEAKVWDPLEDLAISRFDILVAFGAQAMRDFTLAYQAEARIDLTNLPYWDLRAALRPAHEIAEWAAAWPGLGRPDITEQTLRAAHRRLVAQALQQQADAAG